MTQTPHYFLALANYIDALWPENLLGSRSSGKIFDQIGITPVQFEQDPNFRANTEVLFQETLALSLPGISGLSLVISPASKGTIVPFEFIAEALPVMRLVEVPIVLRVSRNLLQPAKRVQHLDGTIEISEIVGEDSLDIILSQITPALDLDGHFTLDIERGIRLPLCLIGGSGVAVEAQGIIFNGGNLPPPNSLPAGWRGLQIDKAKVYLPGELGNLVGELTFEEASFGNGGISGNGSANQDITGQAFGIELMLSYVELAFVQNALTASRLEGQFFLPFFETLLTVDLGFDAQGTFNIERAGVADATGTTTDDRLYVLIKPELFELTVESIGFEVANGKATTIVAGEIRPLVGGLEWPGFCPYRRKWIWFHLRGLGSR